MSDRVRFRVIPNENGMALRALLARRLQRKPKEASSLIRAGGVYVNQLRVRIPNVRVATGERITAYPGADQVERIPPKALRLVHREPAFCVVDKPAGVAAEFPRETCYGTVSDALLRMLADEGVNRPYVGIVHPLERRACGLVMFATRGLTEANHLRTLVEHPIRRTYRMLVRTGPRAPCRVELALVERRDKSLRLPKAGETGTRATIELAPVGRGPGEGGFGPAAQLEAVLVDAPAERIVLHARAADHPLLGDDPDAPVLALWCARMELDHPLTGERLRFDAAPPPWSSAAARPDETA